MTPGLLPASTASDSRRSHKPGETMPPLCKAWPIPQKVISSSTFSVLALADSSISGCTGISVATPQRPSARTLSGWRAAVSSATSALIE